MTKLIAKDAAAAAGRAAAPPAAAAGAEDRRSATRRCKGPKNAPVTIVEFSDFQCPFCGRVVPTLKQLEEQYKGKVRVAFKNQPLPFHPNARPAAEAALAANEQGKFWEMHDKLFANQQALDRAALEKYAQELGLDMDKFKAALDSQQVRGADRRGQRRGHRAWAPTARRPSSSTAVSSWARSRSRSSRRSSTRS